MNSFQDGKEESERKSKRNRKEADKVVKIIEKLLEAGQVSLEDIGVITPYKAQVVLPLLSGFNWSMSRKIRYKEK